MSPLLSALRAATADLHLALHQHPTLAPLESADLTASQYRLALSGLFGFHLRACEALAPHHNLAELVTPSAQWLTQDLTALGLDPHGLGLPPPIEAVAPAAALGVLYVKEGSLLGGRHLARSVQRSLGASAPCRHFLGLGRDTGEHWQAVLKLLNHAPATAAAEICAAAQASFTHLARWLDQAAEPMAAGVDYCPLGNFSSPARGSARLP